MKTLRNIVFCASMAVVLTACGGSPSQPLANQYANAWTGAWVGVQSSDGGAVTLNILDSGKTTGTFARNGGISGAFTGTVSNTGHIVGTIVFPSGGNFKIDGELFHTGQPTGEVDADFSYYWLGQDYVGNLAITPTGNTSSS